MTVCHDPPFLVFSSGLFTLFALSPISLSLSHKSTLHTSSSLHYCLGFVRPPSETWHHTPPFQRSRNAAWSLPSVYSISLFHLLRQEMQSCSHMNQSEPPSGNVCWSFQVPFPSREHEREGEINLEQLQEAKDSDNPRSGIKGEGVRLI